MRLAHDKRTVRRQVLGDTSIHVSHVDQQLRRNFIMHIVPACIAGVTVAVVCMGSLAHANVPAVMAITLGILSTMFLGYICVPVRDSASGENLYGWSKINYVYGNPPPSVFVVQALLMLLAVVAIPVCMIGTGKDKCSVWSSLAKSFRPRAHGGNAGQDEGPDAGQDEGKGWGADNSRLPEIGPLFGEDDEVAFAASL